MKNSLISTSVAVLLASNSVMSFASSVTIPNSFTAGTTAVAADVNANFSAVAAGVNDNDSRVTTNAAAITTNAGGITTNTGNITTNTGNITTNTGNITTNTGNITTNTGNITTNTGNIAANTTAIGNIGNCPSDMVASGSLCVDKYEASVYSAATGGTKFGDQTDDYPCLNDGSDCGATAANPIFARSVAGEHPATNITLYQAAVACANAGKRLPTTTEWQMAAAGTPSGNGDGSTGCNIPAAAGTIGNTGNANSCVSSAGAFDMVGNVWEWSADLHFGGLPSAATTTDFSTVLALGDGYSFLGNANTKDVFVLAGTGPGTGADDGGNAIFGFRCVR